MVLMINAKCDIDNMLINIISVLYSYYKLMSISGELFATFFYVTISALLITQLKKKKTIPDFHKK